MKFVWRNLICAVLLSSGSAQFARAQQQQTVLMRDEAVRRSLSQTSNFQQASINEKIAAQDLRQARTAFLPRVTANPNYIFTSPALGSIANGAPRPPSFLGANAVNEIQGLVTLSGELDTSRRLRAALTRSAALLEAARAGTEVARRTLVEAVDEAYFGLSLATANRRAAEENLKSAVEFARITQLLVDGGEVAPVDVTRAKLQSDTRRNELAQAQTVEKIAADSINVFLGANLDQAVETEDLLTKLPEDNELPILTADVSAERPELVQLTAEQRAAEAEIKAARAERKPQIIYAFDGGFISDSLAPNSIGNSAGVRANVGVSLPLFDFGASRSRQKQAELRAQLIESSRALTQRQLAQQFNAALVSANAAAARIRLTAESVRNAENIVNVAIARYRAGETQILEVTDAQNQLVAQRGAFYQAIFDYQIAKARLRQATGK